MFSFETARALAILKKVLAVDKDQSVSTIACGDKPFGWTSNFDRLSQDKEREGR